MLYAEISTIIERNPVGPVIANVTFYCSTTFETYERRVSDLNKSPFCDGITRDEWRACKAMIKRLKDDSIRV